MNVRRAFVFAALVSLAASPLRAETAEQWIAKARAYLGGDSALNAITSIHFTGVLETTDQVPSAEDPKKLVEQTVRLPVDLVFQKSFQQRITITRPKIVVTDVLDGYEAWQRRSNPANPAQWEITLLDPQQIKRLRANTWENLSFFTGIEKKGGTVRLDGDATTDGAACVKISFIHADNIIFRRYFAKANGRLIKTETENGGEIREEGETILNGVRFPKKVLNKAPNGQMTILEVEKIVLNELIPASEFAVPTLLAK